MTAARRELTAELPLVVTRIDRYWLPASDGRIARFFTRNLYVPHGLRERCRAAAGRAVWRGGAPLPRRRRLTATLLADAQAAPAVAGGRAGSAEAAGTPIRDLERLERQATRVYGFLQALEADLPSCPAGQPLRWILIEDYAMGERITLLLFRREAEHPVAVLKIAATEPHAGRLERERDAIARLRQALPRELASRLPEPLGYQEQGGSVALMLSYMDGRPAYVEMQSSWRPRRHLSRHFEGAALWLGRFHEATQRSGTRPTLPVTEEEIAAVGAVNECDLDLDWLDRLRSRLETRPLTLAAAHGDFWARNLMFAGEGQAEGTGARLPGVIDWGGFREEALPHEDLFHFPFTYGMNYLWRRYRRLTPIEAFRRTFLDETPVSREVRRYFRRYCRLTGFDRGALRPLLQLYLLTRGARRPPGPDTGAAGQETTLPWLKLYRLLHRADRSVFSG